MYVVFYTTYAVQVAIFIFQNTPYILEQLWSVVFMQDWFSIFRAVNDLVENLSKGTHAGFFECYMSSNLAISDKERTWDDDIEPPLGVLPDKTSIPRVSLRDAGLFVFNRRGGCPAAL